MNYRPFLKRCMTPVTIMVVPHSRTRPFKLKVSLIGLAVCCLLSITGAIYVISVGFKMVDYYVMRNKLSYFSRQFGDLRSTIVSLKETNTELSKLLAMKSKKDIINSADLQDTGSLDIEALKKQVNETIESVAAIKAFIAEQKDVYMATPSGWPVQGVISSGFGMRVHPITGDVIKHTGVDIRIPPGTNVKATAPGIVSFSGWTNGSGYIVVLEHGHGFSTAYAHNRKNYVIVGQKVKKGEQIAMSGSTGASTGPHVHYEVWKEGKQVNPAPYLGDTL
ncbi:MAG TPA: M23 family metallopeptidase [Syntrophorhabdaceae bacterium]|nr:M23 family metallopeptidase [Syntrophorhabdaceae bacterium]